MKNALVIHFGEYTYTYLPYRDIWYCEEDADTMSTEDIIKVIKSDTAELRRRLADKAQ